MQTGCKDCPAGTMRAVVESDLKPWDGYDINRFNLATSQRCFGPHHCKNNICVGFEEDSKIYCYGSYDGCLTGASDCSTDIDCVNKYTVNSPKYENLGVVSCPNPVALGKVMHAHALLKLQALRLDGAVMHQKPLMAIIIMVYMKMQLMVNVHIRKTNILG